MPQIKHNDITVNLLGPIPIPGSQAPDFTLTRNDLSEVSLKEFRGKTVVLNIFPSIDTNTCAASVRAFNNRAATMKDTVVLCIARDLPYAMRRFCAAEGIDNVITLSDFRHRDFAHDYGVEMIDGRMYGLFGRVIIVIDPNGIIKYVEVVPVLGHEPDYDTALNVI
jgi:thiol peroxidase